MAQPKLEANGKTWCITACYTDARGVHQKKYKGGFATQAKAKKWATTYAAEMAKKVITDRNITIRQVIEKLLYEKEFVDKVSKNTMGFYEQGFALINGAIGQMKPTQPTAMLLQDFINANLDTPRKCKTICQCLSILYNYMERVDLIDNNIYRKLKIPQYTPKETPYYDLKQYKQLLKAILDCDSPIYTPVLLMGGLGLRPSEALALTNDDIHGNILQIDKAVVYVKRKNQKLYLDTGDTKTEKSVRAFPLEDSFIKEIFRYKTAHNIQSPYLCVTREGNQLLERMFARHLKKVLLDYGLPHISPYGLRHTFGQIQKSVKTDIYTISRLMGHSNIGTTTRTYFHNDNILNTDALKTMSSMIKMEK